MMTDLVIYRNGIPALTIALTPDIVFNKQRMSTHNITARVNVSSALDLRYGDYIEHRGNTYTINTLPDFESEHRDEYEIIFEAVEFRLHDQIVMHEGSSDFPYLGTARDHILLLVGCMNDIDSGWTVGEVDDTELKTIFYEDMYCWGALHKICEDFKLEYTLDGKTINLLFDPTIETSLVFEKGMNKGLYRLTRTSVKDKSVFTKVYGYGGTRNLPEGYRDGAKRITFAERFLAANTDKYKTKVGIFKDDDIFPQRDGTVTGVGLVTESSVEFTLIDTSLDFNINNYRYDGTNPKIIFVSGELAGTKEYEIIKYVHSTKTITFKGFTESDDYVTPNTSFSHKVGDIYRLVDLKLPDEYVVDAENRVKQGTQKFLDENKTPKVSYSLVIDPIYLKTNNIELAVGHKVRIRDVKHNIDNLIRLSSISYPLLYPERIAAIVSDEIVYSAQDSQNIQAVKNGREIKNVNRTNVELARQNVVNLRELQSSVFDPDGNYFTEKIRPGSIETLYFATGAKATNFSLKDVAFKTNVGGDPNSFDISAGQLVHFELKIDGLGFTWNMNSFATSVLDPSKAYYVYARVSRTSLSGSWIVSENIILVESEAGFWNLQAGRLFSVAEGRRDHEFTKGMTFMIGDQITSGVLKSLDGLMFFDMNQGKFNLGTTTSGIDWNVTNAGVLTIRGGVAQNSGGISAPLPVYRGAFSDTVTYYPGDSVTFSGSLWRYRFATPSSGVMPVQGAYWSLEVQKGNDGSDGKYTELRYAKNTSTTSSPPLVDSNPDPLGWSVSQPATSTAEYLWLTSAQKTSTGGLLGAWSTPVRISGVNGVDGSDGDDGAPGAQGPYMVGRGAFDPVKTYVGTSSRIEAVSYSGSWYVTRTDAGTITPGTLPTNTAKWNAFGGVFESIATGMLLATLAYIENLGVRFLSTDQTGSKRVVIDGTQNNIRLLDSLNNILALIDDDSAIENMTYSGGPTTVTYGPGMSVGRSLGHVDGFSSIGRKGIHTSGWLHTLGHRTVNLRRITTSGSYSLDGNAHYVLIDSTASGAIAISLPDVADYYFSDNRFRVIIIFNYGSGTATISGGPFAGGALDNIQSPAGLATTYVMPANSRKEFLYNGVWYVG